MIFQSILRKYYCPGYCKLKAFGYGTTSCAALNLRNLRRRQANSKSKFK
jgi:hypothetical protein